MEYIVDSDEEESLESIHSMSDGSNANEKGLLKFFIKKDKLKIFYNFMIFFFKKIKFFF